MNPSLKLQKLPPYIFAIIDALKTEVEKQIDVEIIDLSMGSPDQPAPQHVVEALRKEVLLSYNHGYSRKNGVSEIALRQAISNWYDKRFGIQLDPSKNVLPLIGSKEGIAHLASAILNPRDIAIVPSPSYPIHFNSVLLAGGHVHHLPLLEKEQYLPNFKTLDASLLQKTKLLFLNYPHNPTTAMASLDFYEKTVFELCNKNLILVSDLAYSEINYHPEKKIPSLLQVKDALNQNIIEFHTLSKTYNMAGWRIGFAVGNAEILSILEKIKTYCDFGIFRPIQYAAISALSGDQSCIQKTISTYKNRMDYFVKALNDIGWPISQPEATFYLWTALPHRYAHLSSLEFVSELLRKTGVVLSPGSGFGPYG